MEYKNSTSEYDFTWLEFLYCRNKSLKLKSVIKEWTSFISSFTYLASVFLLWLLPQEEVDLIFLFKLAL